jgi:hypothetical protein
MTRIQPIETQYAGRYFRSRLESRWAVLFDLIGLPWEYELVGLSVGQWRYLPDFKLPSVPALVEVKPHNITDQEEMRLSGIVSALHDEGVDLWVLRGVPDAEHHTLYIAGQDRNYQFMPCRRCRGVCLSTRDGDQWIPIGQHTCGDHDRAPVESYESEFRKAQRMKFDHHKPKEASNARH